ncbi:histidinol-phosphatase, inositol monophosphatase family [Fibrobacter sp. UWH9]|uniref:inositol monophosphatase family protein n=1 Tax=unclassified Fibrobacter TaxID=2634177 RepID=UPI0009129979|nr:MULTISPECIES: inositol monophosphatase family protein [unclassified Fibrobacter]MDO4946053.1 inositol monophosphatase family protein [Fibrobacter sp.]OWV07704.1 histidinol phosphate phosphatase [Fibrobacter sp. UWH3]SHG75416.1 histidinol-phosphatase, inositol monophosphatase family [Fibrobacter sp. UWH9]SHK54109.1 histidinol-phosphatase, inositol monophosphatase family [Fibrobacter sp. UWH6]SHK57432.1 histidinol-phosphatase, inositol monophosphatase family [Fibrobacter sp. UWH5]
MSATKENLDLLNIALKAAELAQGNILKYFQNDVGVEWKADKTPVTIADKSTEELCREFWAKETPGFGVIGEEFGIESPDAEYQWVIDPIDGTKAFIHGVPLFGTLIALYRRGEAIASLIRIPAMNTAVWAVKDGGAFLGSSAQDCRVSKCSKVEKLSDALVLSGTVNTMETAGYGEQYANVRRAARLHRGWGDCYGYYLVAAGRAELMIDPIVSLWDIAPYPLLFSEAGGKFSMLDGRTELFDANGKPVAPIYEGYTSFASNGLIHNEVAGYFKK